MAFQGDALNIPTSLLVWILSVCVAGVGAFFSVCSHILLSIYKSVRNVEKMQNSDKAEVESRLKTLERHDEKNEQQRDLLLQYLMKQSQQH